MFAVSFPYLVLSKHSSNTILGAFVLTLLPESTIFSLLLLHAELPFLSNLHIVVFEPDQIFAVPPVRGENFLPDDGHLARGLILIDVPVFLAVNNKGFKPAALDITYLFDHVFALFEFSYLRCVLSKYQLGCGLRIFEWFALVYHASELILLPALCLAPEPGLLVGTKNDDSLPVVC